ncbi:protein STRUBBELIG-RECEPTOR FAMILY 2-like [Rhododendron vialii]|uniref:protein STRUBBELIG-RECEPTOR FAMILY 2-like n=1 Tax=Rhododendron vialii TaxID=182163 RepID=UPI00265F7917|nr:protein STRUBBELIG-RECEPTOR FAMILY 2-like [Rhododendron vialii]
MIRQMVAVVDRSCMKLLQRMVKLMPLFLTTSSLYLHSTCLPPVGLSNLKATNILLDDELMPRLSDCGLAVLRPLTSNSVKLKASEMAISNTSYVAPEHIQNKFDSVKGDISAFGVLLLELLTGKRPFDGFRPREEQSLVK